MKLQIEKESLINKKQLERQQKLLLLKQQQQQRKQQEILKQNQNTSHEMKNISQNLKSNAIIMKRKREEEINKNYTKIYDLSKLDKYEIIPFEAARMDQEIIILSKVSQEEKNKLLI